MRTAREVTERTIHLAELHIAQQEARMERQKKLIESLEADGHADMAEAARHLLSEMAVLLARMHDELAQAQGRLIAREGL
jgi:hypothetical protein